MILEEAIVRALNRRNRNGSAQPVGFHLGEAEMLVGRARAPFCLSPRSIQHSFLCGRTGMGKTTCLLQLMAEHLRLGIPFLFIDFHGPATKDLLVAMSGAPSDRDFILLEPSADPVIGWDPLPTSGGSPYPVVQELVGIFHHRLWPDAWGPRLEETLRNTLLPLAEANLTLLEATSFLSRPEFRRAVLRKVTLPEVYEYWTARFDHLSRSQQSLMVETVLNKLSVFHDPALRYVVGQQDGSLNIDQALASGQTIIANLSAGSLRSNNFLLASLLVAKFKAAVYRRSAKATPYSIFLDEFQEMFALDALDDYLRSFRKFNCSVYLATQHLQLPAEIHAAIFGNCSRFIAFSTSATDAAFLGREFGPTEKHLVTELLPELPTGQALVKARGEPVRLLRVARPAIKATRSLVAEGRARCLRLGESRGKVDREIQQRLDGFSHCDPISVSKEKLGWTVLPKVVDLDLEALPEGYGD